ncbi:MAG: hypothetical protein SOT55_06420 [Candidatus Cryptobacteroides sp.]|nr:hypothetical protein [Candidatus Cryptobacteroides sp.]
MDIFIVVNPAVNRITGINKTIHYRIRSIRKSSQAYWRKYFDFNTFTRSFIICVIQAYEPHIRINAIIIPSVVHSLCRVQRSKDRIRRHMEGLVIYVEFTPVRYRVTHSVNEKQSIQHKHIAGIGYPDLAIGNLVSLTVFLISVEAEQVRTRQFTGTGSGSPYKSVLGCHPAVQRLVVTAIDSEHVACRKIEIQAKHKSRPNQILLVIISAMDKLEDVIAASIAVIITIIGSPGHIK